MNAAKLFLRASNNAVFSPVMKRIFWQEIGELCVFAQEPFSLLLDNCLFLCLYFEEPAEFFFVSFTFFCQLTPAFLYKRFYLKTRTGNPKSSPDSSACRQEQFPDCNLGIRLAAFARTRRYLSVMFQECEFAPLQSHLFKLCFSGELCV